MTGNSLATVPRPTHHAAPVHEPPAAIRATGIIVVLTVVLAILAIAFALPAVGSKPHDIPIGAAGPMAAGGQVADILEQRAPDAFALTYTPARRPCGCDLQSRCLRGDFVRARRPHPAGGVPVRGGQALLVRAVGVIDYGPAGGDQPVPFGLAVGRQRGAVRYRRECPPGDQFPHPRIETTGGGVESSEHAPQVVLPSEDPGGHPVLDQLTASQFRRAAGEPVIGKVTGELSDRR